MGLDRYGDAIADIAGIVGSYLFALRGKLTRHPGGLLLAFNAISTYLA